MKPNLQLSAIHDLLTSSSSMAAVHNVSSISMNSFNFLQNHKLLRSSFCYNGNVSDMRELDKRFACSCINRFQMLHHFSSLSSSKQNNLVLASTFGTGHEIWFSPRHHNLRLQTGTPKLYGRPACLTSLARCHVQREESQGTLSGESIALDQETLERDLQIAIEEEDYELAAKIRDSLRFLLEDNKASVLAANTRFYNSFKTGDLATMQSLWAEGDHVCCVHPGVSGISGYDLVMSSWEYVLANYEFPLEIEVKDVRVHVRGDLAYVTCMEFIKTKGSSWGKQSVTNVFERIDGQWFICIHHASGSNFEK